MTRRVLRHFLICTVAALLVSCAHSQSTYFRMLNASLEDERRDWGLCGGNFYPSGQIRPEVSDHIFDCMYKKGYVTLNDYYLEEHIGFASRDNLEDYYVPTQTFAGCGMIWLGEGAFCEHQGFVVRKQLPSFVNCMSNAGYEITLPRFRAGVRIVEDLEELSPLFCTFLTRRNQKGGIGKKGSGSFTP